MPDRVHHGSAGAQKTGIQRPARGRLSSSGPGLTGSSGSALAGSSGISARLVQVAAAHAGPAPGTAGAAGAGRLGMTRYLPRSNRRTRYLYKKV
jgi:hypothetical protein